MTGVLAVAEHRDRTLRDASYKLIRAGRELADASGNALHFMVVGSPVENFAD